MWDGQSIEDQHVETKHSLSSPARNLYFSAPPNISHELGDLKVAAFGQLLGPLPSVTCARAALRMRHRVRTLRALQSRVVKPRRCSDRCGPHLCASILQRIDVYHRAGYTEAGQSAHLSTMLATP
jgi:hypothetical protein